MYICEVNVYLWYNVCVHQVHFLPKLHVLAEHHDLHLAMMRHFGLSPVLTTLVSLVLLVFCFILPSSELFEQLVYNCPEGTGVTS